jgi:hypothetical protein
VPKIRTEALAFNWDLHSRYFYSLRSILYQTDVGFLFQNKIKDEAYTFYLNQQNVQIRHGSFLYPTTFGTITFDRQPKSAMYYRAYSKLQTMLAKIGGIIQGIKFIGYCFAYLITKNMFLVDMINYIFTFEEDKPTLDTVLKIAESGMLKINNEVHK